MSHKLAFAPGNSLIAETAYPHLRMFLLHSSLCVLFFGMSIALAMSPNMESGGTGFMAVLLGLVMVLSLGLHSLNPAGGGLPGIFTLLILSEIFAGLPGLIYWQSGDDLRIGLSFAALLAIRCYIVFWALPTSRSHLHGSFERIVLSWALAATTLFAFGSLLVARAAGISLDSTARLSGEALGHWTNANTTGLYCAFGVLICIIARFIPIWIRLTAGGLTFYCLLLSQSRTAIATIIVSGICGLFVGRIWNWKSALLGICALLLALSFVDINESVDLLESNPTLAAISQRFTRQPGRGGDYARLDVIESGLEVWSRSPLFGVGFEAQDARFENGYLSLACEEGAIGLLLYLALIGLLCIQIMNMMQAGAGSDARELGGYLFCITVFVLVHGLGERTQGFQIGSVVSNVWALLVASALSTTHRPERSYR